MVGEQKKKGRKKWVKPVKQIPKKRGVSPLFNSPTSLFHATVILSENETFAYEGVVLLWIENLQEGRGRVSVMSSGTNLVDLV
jgi:hypothetical protein